MKKQTTKKQDTVKQSSSAIQDQKKESEAKNVKVQATDKQKAKEQVEGGPITEEKRQNLI